MSEPAGRANQRDDGPASLGRILRRETGPVLASLIRQLGDFDRAEDALQEACVAALEQWPAEGVPARPGAWLLTAARHKGIDRLRREARRSTKEEDAERLAELLQEQREEAPGVHPLADDRLRLIFTCCHPALAAEAQVALTLRAVGGLTTPEIARAFLVPEATMAQRLVRAKRKIKVAGIPYRVPLAGELPARLDGVLAVVYSIFTEGHTASAGDALVRDELCAEAVRLARGIVELLPEEPEAVGLLALLLLHDARRATRVDPAGELVLLADQDRSRWDRDQIAEGVRLVERALGGRRLGPYQLEAAIAALHAEARSADDTDWPQIASLYDVLARVAPSPAVELNRAVALALADGPAVGLSAVGDLAGSAAGTVEGWYLFHAVRADLLRRLDRTEESAAAYRRALDLVSTAPERRFLAARLAELG